MQQNLQYAGEQTPFRRWLYVNGCMMKKSNKSPETHLFFDGGRVSVPSAETERQMLESYAQFIETGMWIYMIEKRTPVFSMFSEFDYLSGTPLEEADVLSLAREAHVNVMCKLFDFDDGAPGGQDEVLVSWVPSVSWKGEASSFKTGIHFNWRLRVDVSMAKVIRKRLLEHMPFADTFSEDSGKRPTNAWVDVIDPVVYENNGLRLLYSRKAEKCVYCVGSVGYARNRGKRPGFRAPGDDDELFVAACDVCNGTGKVDVGRMYSVIAVMARDGSIDAKKTAVMKSHVPSAVRAASIRVLDPEATPHPFSSRREVVAEIERLRVSLLQDETFKKKKNTAVKRRRLRKNVDAVGGDATTTTTTTTTKNDGRASNGADGSLSELEDVSMCDAKFAAVAEYLFKTFPGNPVLSSLRMSRAKPKKSDSAADGAKREARFYLAITKSRFCQNKGSDHTHAGVYFVISSKGAYQKCFSRKSVVYQPHNVSCAEFKSAVKKIPQSTSSAIFTRYEARLLKKKGKMDKIMTNIYGNPPTDGTRKDGATAADAVWGADDADRPADDDDGVSHRTPPPRKSAKAAEGDAAQTKPTPLKHHDIPRGAGEFDFCLAAFSNVKGVSKPR
jgi:hypothetical protein